MRSTRRVGCPASEGPRWGRTAACGAADHRQPKLAQLVNLGNRADFVSACVAAPRPARAHRVASRGQAGCSSTDAVPHEPGRQRATSTTRAFLWHSARELACAAALGVQLADVRLVAALGVGLVVDDLQLAVLVHVAVVALDVAVRIALLVPELAILPGKVERKKDNNSTRWAKKGNEQVEESFPLLMWVEQAGLAPWGPSLA